MPWLLLVCYNWNIFVNSYLRKRILSKILRITTSARIQRARDMAFQWKNRATSTSGARFWPCCTLMCAPYNIHRLLSLMYETCRDSSKMCTKYTRHNIVHFRNLVHEHFIWFLHVSWTHLECAARKLAAGHWNKVSNCVYKYTESESV